MSTTKVGAALLESGSKGVDIASASTIVIGKDGSYFDITGTTGIGTMTVDAGRIFTLQFDGAVILTHSSTLYLAGAANFTTEANDHLTFIAVAANDVRQIGTGLKDGGSPIAAAGGKVVQVVYVMDSSVDTGTTVMPAVDDSIPQNNEGDEYFSLAITPTNASNLLKIEVLFNAAVSIETNYQTVAIFQDSTANAIAAVSQISVNVNSPQQYPITHWMVAGTTSATTFKVRSGNVGSFTLTFNGRGTTRWHGGTYASSITITEYEV